MKGKQGKQRLADNQVLGDYDSSSNAELHAPGDYPEGFSSKGPPVGLDSGTPMFRGGSLQYQITLCACALLFR